MDPELKESPVKTANSWQEKLFELVAKLRPIKELGAAVVRFVSELAHLPESKEAHQLTNLKAYVQTVDEILWKLESEGVPRQELMRIAEELYLPVAHATLDGMLLRRRLGAVDAEPTESEIKKS